MKKPSTSKTNKQNFTRKDFDRFTTNGAGIKVIKSSNKNTKKK